MPRLLIASMEFFYRVLIVDLVLLGSLCMPIMLMLYYFTSSYISLLRVYKTHFSCNTLLVYSPIHRNRVSSILRFVPSLCGMRLYHARAGYLSSRFTKTASVVWSCMEKDVTPRDQASTEADVWECSYYVCLKASALGSVATTFLLSRNVLRNAERRPGGGNIAFALHVCYLFEEDML